MKNLHLYLIPFFASGCMLLNAQWTTVGNAAVANSSAGATQITFSAGGTPYLYYYDNSNYVPVALKYDGVNWDSLGSGLAATQGTSGGRASEFALSQDSVPYIACSNSGALIVLSCVSGTWSTVGNTGVAGYIEVAAAVDGSDNPYIAYTKAATQSTYFDSCVVIEYTNGSWTQLGTAFPAEGISITISNNVPYVLYSDSNNYCNVVKFDGSNWVAVGPAAFSIVAVSGSSLQAGSDGTVYVAYSDTSNGNHRGTVSVVKLNGSSWTNIGGSEFDTGQLQTHHALALDNNGNLFVTYINSNAISVVANEGSAWFNVGPAGFGNTYTAFSSVSVSPAGIPYTAYDSSVFSAVTVKEYTGKISAVEELKAGAMSIFPNPTNNIVNLNLPQGEHGQLSLYDDLGRVVMTLERTETGTQQINVSHLTPGIYMLTYHSAENLLVAKVIKE